MTLAVSRCLSLYMRICSVCLFGGVCVTVWLMFLYLCPHPDNSLINSPDRP